MRSALTRTCALLAVLLALVPSCFPSAYDARPRVIVVVVVDQLREDLLERFHDKFGQGGFRLLMERGAYFNNCEYDYADTRTGPGHSTLLTGAYANGHGIMANRYWDPQLGKMVTPVQDAATKIVGREGGGASPKNLLASTLGDELKLSSGGRSRVYAIALKETAAILSGGHAADAAYWTDDPDGAWITSSYYRNELPKWVNDFNASGRADRLWNQKYESKEVPGATFSTEKKPGSTFYRVVGYTPYVNAYELEFARELIVNEKLGSGPATDLLVASISGFDLVGHAFGPDSPQIAAELLALDRQLSDFFGFLGQQLGFANVWIALSGDHGAAPLPELAKEIRVSEGLRYNGTKKIEELNRQLAAKFGKPAQYVVGFDPPTYFLNQEAFPPGQDEQAAEAAVGEMLLKLGFRGYFTRAQLAKGDVPHTELGRLYEHSFSPLPGWYVMTVPQIYSVSGAGTDHGSPYSYDRHVPLALYGLPFVPGTYRAHSEPVDMVSTFSSLLGINQPTHAIGRVLTEALQKEGGR